MTWGGPLERWKQNVHVKMLAWLPDGIVEES
jgi:hypothetical protein